MVSTNLKAYLIRMRPVREDLWCVFHLNGEFDAWTHLRDYLESRRGQFVELASLDPDPATSRDDKAMKLLDRPFVEDRRRRSFAGLIEVGRRGTKSNVYDLATTRAVHQINTRESVMPPYFFRIWLPDGASAGLMICEGKGAVSCKTAFAKDFKKYMSREHDTLVEFALFTDPSVLNDFFGAGATPRELRVVAHKVGGDTRDALRRSRLDGRELDAGAEMVVTIKNSSVLSNLKRRLSAVASRQRNATVRDLVSVYGLGTDYDEAYVKMKNADGKERTFCLTTPRDEHLGIDITDQVGYDEGNPVFEDIDEQARVLFEEVRHHAFE